MILQATSATDDLSDSHIAQHECLFDEPDVHESVCDNIDDDSAGDVNDSLESDMDTDSNTAQTEPGDASYNQPLYEGSKVTVGAVIVLLMTFILRHHLPWCTVEDLLMLLQIVLPASSLLPKTRFLFEKPFRACTGIIDFCYYCPVCFVKVETRHINECLNCNETVNLDLYKSGNFFITLPLTAQLRDMFENSNISQLISHRFQRSKTNTRNIEDIYDGSVYNEAVGSKDASHISLTWNTDGVPVFQSSNYSMWPIQCVINELPPHLRRKHVLIAGLWFGVNKPNFNSFLKPFIDECNSLKSMGFTWFTNTKKTCTTFVTTLVCAVDSVARCMLQGIKQFNGEYGCSWCLHPGQQVEKGSGTVRVYDSKVYDKRTHSGLISHAQDTLTGGSCFGVLYASPLLLLKHFDIVCGFSVDYLHCVLLGVTRALGCLWLESEHHNEPYYIGRQITAVDERLMSIRPPASITRAPRSIKLRCYWKASEWRNWLHIYSVICLQGILKPAYFKHFLLLVCAVEILRGFSISVDDLNAAEQMLHLFVYEFASLYGLPNMSYNVHQLSHLSDTVRQWGPLWTTSTFPFESGNGLLMKLFHGTRGLPLQVSRKFIIFRNLPILAYKYISRDSDEIYEFFTNLLEIYSPVQKALRVAEDVVLLGQYVYRPLTFEERTALDGICTSTLTRSVYSYSRAVVKGYLINAEKSCNQRRRNNSCIWLKNQVCGTVENLVVIDDHPYVLFRQLVIGREFICHKQAAIVTRSIRIVTRVSGELMASHVKNFENPCIFINNKRIFSKPLVAVICAREEGD